jgi:ammonium transporter, Amt family
MQPNRLLRRPGLTACGLLLTCPATLMAADAPPVDTGNTAWLLTSTALVLFMMIPGLALFYAGLVRAKNVLSVLMQCFALTAILSLVWLAGGYSLAFAGEGTFIGDLSKAFLRGVTPDSFHGNVTTGVPELVFFAYQMTFFVITPGLIIGAVVERMKFSALLLFMTLWAILVYLPVCYMVWYKGNYFGLEAVKDAAGTVIEAGVIDHAGGIVVHITAGIAALVACIMVGRRRDHGRIPLMPHNLPMTVTGAAMLWVGWFGFNAGSGLAANGAAGMTLIVTHISACTATLVWMGIEWAVLKRPTVLGAATGSIAGLAAITPAAGSVGPVGALIIGTVSAAVCWYFSVKLKAKFKYDDSLDVFGVHGVGGFIGTILLGFLAHDTFGGLNNTASFSKQLLAAVYTTVYSGVISAVLLLVIGKTIGLRVSEQSEREGLDQSEHGENAYNDSEL